MDTVAVLHFYLCSKLTFCSVLLYEYMLSSLEAVSRHASTPTVASLACQVASIQPRISQDYLRSKPYNLAYAEGKEATDFLFTEPPEPRLTHHEQ
jgi:hypothetical protein